MRLSPRASRSSITVLLSCLIIIAMVASPLVSFAADPTTDDLSNVVEPEQTPAPPDPEITPTPEVTATEEALPAEPTPTPEPTDLDIGDPTPTPAPSDSSDDKGKGKGGGPTSLAAQPSGATSNVSYTLEGCNSPGSDYDPSTSDFVCDDSNYTTGNLGKDWEELDLVPHRITIDVGAQGTGTQTNTFTLAADFEYTQGGYEGYDLMSTLTLDPSSDDSCSLDTLTGQSTLIGVVGGVYSTIARDVTVSQDPGTFCMYNYTLRLAGPLQASLYSGSSLHAYLESPGIGEKRVPLPVNQVEPQELDKTMSGTQTREYPWTISKTVGDDVDLGNTCIVDNLESDGLVRVRVEWTKGVATDGDIHVTSTITATNPAHRTLLIQIKDEIRSGTTVLPSADVVGESGDPDGNPRYYPSSSTYATIPAATATDPGTLVWTDHFTVPAGTTNLNDVATGSYKDPIIGDVLGDLTSSANATLSNPTQTIEHNSVTITDTETMTGDGLSFRVEATSGDSGTFDPAYTPSATAADVTTLGWSKTTTTSGFVVFDKRIVLDGTAIFDDGSLDDTATVTDGETVLGSDEGSVDISADALGTITIDKTIPDVLTGDQEQTFTFDVKDSTDAIVASPTITFIAGETSGSVTVSDLELGDYTVEERSTDGWIDQSSESASISVRGCDDTVEFANALAPATAQVKKVTVPSGDPQTWTFTLNGPGLPQAGVTATRVDGQDFVDFVDGNDDPIELGEGSYTITENSNDDYTSLGSSECSFTVDFPEDAGRVYQCTFTNTAKPAHADVTKISLPPGYEEGWTFTLNDHDAETTDETVTTTANDHIVDFTTDLLDGVHYTIEETSGPSNADAFEGTPSGDCDFTVDLPDDSNRTFHCTFTNTAKPAHADVTKVSVPEGDEAGWTFTLNDHDAETTDETVTTTANDHTVAFTTDLLDGVHYTIEETSGPDNEDAFTAQGSGDCDFTVDLPDDSNTTFHCTFTNTAKPAHADVTKVSIPEGSEAGWTFTLSDNDPLTTNDETVTTTEGDHTVAFTTDLQNGVTYTILETDGPANEDDFTPAPSGECEFTVHLPADSGTTFHCTFTNVAAPGHAAVTKVSVPGGSEAGWTFTLNDHNEETTDETVTTTENDHTLAFETDLLDGVHYTIEETSGPDNASDFTPSASEDCDFTVDLPGDSNTTFSCTFTNTAEPAHADVLKVSVPEGSEAGWTFTLNDNNPETTDETVTTTAESHTMAFTTDLQNGVHYSIEETSGPDNAGDFSPQASGDCDFTVSLPADSNKTFHCTFTNTARPAHAAVIKITNPSGQEAGWEFKLTGPIEGTETVVTDSEGHATFQTPLQPGIYTITETQKPGWIVSPSSGTCQFTVEFPADANETFTCTFTNTKPTPTPTPPPPPPPTPTPTPKTDVAIDKADSADPVTAGDNFDYIMTVVNNGPITAENVTASDTLPAGVGFVSVSTTTGSCTGGATITCSLGTMAVGATVTITVTVSTNLDTPELLSNTATVNTTTDESDLTNNQDTEPTTVVKPAGRIVITKQTLPDGAVDTFDFSGDLSGTLGDDESMEGEFPAGTYAVTEDLPAPNDLESHWELDSVVCDDDDSTGDVEAQTATITVAAGETVTCTFTNLFVEVLPQFIDKPDKPKPEAEPPAVLPAQLPFTGSDSGRFLPIGLLMVLVGSILVIAVPRRRRT